MSFKKISKDIPFDQGAYYLRNIESHWIADPWICLRDTFLERTQAPFALVLIRV